MIRPGLLPCSLLQLFHRQGRHGLYLEDLYVAPEHRGQGPAWRCCSTWQIAVAPGTAARFEWSVLDGNTPSIAPYDSLGARPQSEWIRYRLTGAEAQALADGARP